jgi:hypothetical protein
MMKSNKQNRGRLVFFCTYNEKDAPAKPGHVFYRVKKNGNIVERGEIEITDIAKIHDLIKQMDKANCPF